MLQNTMQTMYVRSNYTVSTPLRQPQFDTRSAPKPGVLCRGRWA
jgi:hypothetical protein